MPEYIEREAFLAELKERHDYVMQDPEISKAMKWCEAVCFGRTKDILETIPAADVVKRERGEWVFADCGYCTVATCSVCGTMQGLYINGRVPDWDFCPACGADMRPEGGAER